MMTTTMMMMTMILMFQTGLGVVFNDQTFHVDRKRRHTSAETRGRLVLTAAGRRRVEGARSAEHFHVAVVSLGNFESRRRRLRRPTRSETVGEACAAEGQDGAGGEGGRLQLMCGAGDDMKCGPVFPRAILADGPLCAVIEYSVCVETGFVTECRKWIGMPNC